VTAAACQAAFDLGATACTLYPDADNSTRNHVYRRIGLRQVVEVVDARLTAVSTAPEAGRS
jgi:predicted GNAT family acetyltransferase